MLFVEAPHTTEEVEMVAHELAGVPLLFNWAEGGKTPPISLGDLRALGFRLVIFPVGALLAATAAVQRILNVIKTDGTPQRGLGDGTGFRKFLEIIGLAEIDEIGKQFA